MRRVRLNVEMLEERLAPSASVAALDGLDANLVPSAAAGSIQASDTAGNTTSVNESFDTTPTGAVPANWSSWSSNSQYNFGASPTVAVSGQGLTSAGMSTTANRAWYNDALAADVQAAAAIFASSLTPAEIIVRGSNLATSTPTYYAVSVTRGVSISLLSVVNGVSTTLATLQSSVYTSGLWLQVSLTVEGDQLQARVQRGDTGQWLNTFGVWQSTPSAALDATDQSISGQGLVGLARPASYAGNISFDNFSAGPATNDITSPALQISVPSGGSNLSGTVTIPVSVQDSSGIGQVQYLVDGNLVAINDASPFDWTLITPNFTNGAHVLTVVAFDAAGNVSQTQAQVTFDNPNVGVQPVVPQHYPNIRIAELAYSGNPMGTVEQQLLQSSVDLVVPAPTYLSTINQVSPNTPSLIYSNVSNLYGSLLTNWLNDAEANGVSPEQAFYHVAQPTAFSGSSPSSQPVDWFWNVELGPNSGTGGYQYLTGVAHGSTTGEVPFGSAGQSLYIGYTDMFNQINFALAKGAQSGWTYAVEYPTVVDANGNPTAWQTLTLNTDGTNGLTQSGQMEFDPPTGWTPAAIPGSTALLYYVRVRTIAGTAAQAPSGNTILGDDYVNANGGTSGVIPVYDFAADVNHTGYLTSAEYAAAESIGDDARFAYQSRLFYPYYGQMRFVLDPTQPAVQAWAVQYETQFLNANPLAGGIFMDNSSGANPIAGIPVLESTATYSSDYSAMLGAIDRSIAPRWIMANTSNGGVGTDQVVEQTAATMEESAIRAMNSTWAQFTDLASTVAHYQALTNPAAYLVLDSTSTGGAETDPRTQIATLAYYYLIGNPQTTFLMLWGGEAPASTWTQHWFNALSFNVGLPEGGYSLFATGQDPSNTALTYNIYQRQYTNALVLYKPLSYTLGVGTGTTAANTATTVQLGGTYQLLNADGTLGPPITSISLLNGQGAVLIKSVTITPAPTTTSVSAPAITYGSDGLVTVSVAASASTPSGNVTLSVDGGTALSGALVNGSFTFNVGVLSAGTHMLDAEYPAQGNYAASGDTAISLSAAPMVTSNSTNLAANAPSITITGFGFDPTAANNTVVFNDGAVGSVTTASSTSLFITFSAEPASVGSLTAVVTTDGVSSGAATQVATLVPLAAIIGAPATSPEGTAINLGSSIIDPLAIDSFIWSVLQNGAPIASGTAANLSFTPQTAGSDIVTFSATDSGGNKLSATTTIAVTRVAPTAAITGPATGTAGQALSYTFKATQPSMAETAAGFIFVINWGDGSAIQTIAATANNGSGVTSTHTFAAAGPFTVHVTATDQENAISAPATLAVSINHIASTISLTGLPSPTLVNRPFTLTATVSGGTGTGTVQFAIDGGNLGSPVALSGGKASAQEPGQSAGSHTITATYGGSPSMAGSSAAVVAMVVYGFRFVAPAAGAATTVGQTVPIKFSVTDYAGAPAGGTGVVTSVLVAPVNANGTLGTPFAPASVGGAGLRYDSKTNVYELDWNTDGLKRGTYEIEVELADGTLHMEKITLKA